MTAITHAYVRYVGDNKQAIVPVTNIKDFKPSGPDGFNDKIKYNVKWDDDCKFYKARILLLGASEEDLEAKLETGRLRVRKVISSDSSEEEPAALEKENTKTKKKHLKEKQASATKVDLMKVLEQKKKKIAANQEPKKIDIGELEEKYRRAERHIGRMEKELREKENQLREKEKELIQLRNLNFKLQEIVIKKIEHLKAPAAAAMTSPPAPADPVRLPLLHQPPPAHDALAHDALAHDALAHNALAHDALAHDALAHDALDHDALDHDAPAHDAPAYDAPALNALVPAAMAPIPVLRHNCLPAIQHPARHEVEKVDIGQGVLVDKEAWDKVLVKKKNAVYVKEMAVAVFGDSVLMESCVLGKHAPKYPNRPPKQALCPHKIGVMRDVYQARLESQGMPRKYAEEARSSVTKFINEKIGDLRKQEKRRLQAAGIDAAQEENATMGYY